MKIASEIQSLLEAYKPKSILFSEHGKSKPLNGVTEDSELANLDKSALMIEDVLSEVGSLDDNNSPALGEMLTDHPNKNFKQYIEWIEFLAMLMDRKGAGTAFFDDLDEKPDSKTLKYLKEIQSEAKSHLHVIKQIGRAHNAWK